MKEKKQHSDTSAAGSATGKLPEHIHSIPPEKGTCVIMNVINSNSKAELRERLYDALVELEERDNYWR